MRRPLALICLAFVAAALAQPPEPAGRRYALLVGVRQYDKNELRDLRFPENDVAELAQVLLAAGYRERDVVLLTQSRGAAETRFLPTAANVRAELKLLLGGAREGDSVLLGFAGHGIQFKGDKEVYFCPADARLADKNTLVSLTEVYKELEKCPAGFKLLLSDACRNEPQTNHSRSRASVELESASRPQKQPPPGGVVALFSCSEGQLAFEDEKVKQGVFFHYVVRGLKGDGDGNRDGQVTLNELDDYLQKEVYDHARAEFRAAQQPERVGATRSRLPLVTLANAPTAAASAPAAERKPDAPAAKPPTHVLMRSGQMPIWAVFDADGTKVHSVFWKQNDRSSTPYGALEQVSWDTLRGTEVGVLPLLPAGKVFYLSSVCGFFGPECRRLVSNSWRSENVGSEDEPIRRTYTQLLVYDFPAGDIVFSTKEFASSANPTVSPDGQWIAAMLSNKEDRTIARSIFLWDVGKTGVKELKGHADEVLGLRFSPAGNRVVSWGKDYALVVWDPRSTTPLQTIRGHFNHVSAAAFSADGKLLAAADADEDANLKRFVVWDVETGQERHTLPVRGHKVTHIAWHSDGKRLAFTQPRSRRKADGEVLQMVPVDGTAPLRQFGPESGSSLEVSDLQVSPTGQWLLGRMKTPYGKHRLSFAPDDRLMLWQLD